MKILLQIFVVLSLYIYTVPIDEWDMMSKPEKKERLQQGIDMIKLELGCKNPHIEVDIDKQFLYLYGECDNGKYIGTIRSPAISRSALNERGVCNECPSL